MLDLSSVSAWSIRAWVVAGVVLLLPRVYPWGIVHLQQGLQDPQHCGELFSFVGCWVAVHFWYLSRWARSDVSLQGRGGYDLTSDLADRIVQLDDYYPRSRRTQCSNDRGPGPSPRSPPGTKWRTSFLDGIFCYTLSNRAHDDHTCSDKTMHKRRLYLRRVDCPNQDAKISC